MTSKPQLLALTGARGIAAWLVVLHHAQRSLGDVAGQAFRYFTHGYLAVDFFFILSGFVIWLTYSDRIRAGGYAAIPGFLKRRIARIWPLHVFMLGCWAVLVLILAAGGTPLAGYHFSQLPLQTPSSATGAGASMPITRPA